MVHGLLIAVAPLVLEHGLGVAGFSTWDARACLLSGICDLPGPGIKPVSSALAGRFFAPPSPTRTAPLPTALYSHLILRKSLCWITTEHRNADRIQPLIPVGSQSSWTGQNNPWKQPHGKAGTSCILWGRETHRPWEHRTSFPTTVESCSLPELMQFRPCYGCLKEWLQPFPGGLEGVKNPPANAGDVRDACSIPGSGWSPGEGHGNPAQHPMDRGAWRAMVRGVSKSRTRLNRLGTHSWPSHVSGP